MTRHLYSTCIGMAILLFILGAAAPAAATDWGVNTTHYRELPSGPSYPSATPIRGAVDAATTGDTITVEYGIYDGVLAVADKDLEITGTPSGMTCPSSMIRPERRLHLSPSPTRARHSGGFCWRTL